MVKLEDIARKCSVSKMVVSKVLSKGKQKSSVRFSEKTAEKVRKVAKKLGYRPNLLASSLSSKKTDSIGLVVTIKDNGIAYLTESCLGVIETAAANGYSVLTVNLYNKLDAVPAIESLLDRRVEGILTLPASCFHEGAAKKKIRAAGIPWVSCFQRIRGIAGILPDIKKCSALGTEYLCGKGYKRIAFITEGTSEGITDDLASESEVEGEYTRILEKYNLEPRPELLQRMNHSVQGGKDAMKKLLSLKQPPDAVFVTADILAIGAIRTIREAGLNVPDDIAVLGWDNLQASLEFSDVPLSTIEPGKYEAGKKACELLINKIKSGPKKDKTEKIVIEPKLVLRSSA